MRKLEAGDLKNLGLLKHYRIIRKWACKNNGLNDADLELLIYLDCVNHFTKKDFKIGTYSYSWNNIEIEQPKNIIFTQFLLNLNN
mgnify:CR=1 FL=1